jgi:hypothetical protein
MNRGPNIAGAVTLVVRRESLHLFPPLSAEHGLLNDPVCVCMNRFDGLDDRHCVKQAQCSAQSTAGPFYCSCHVLANCSSVA